MDLKGEKTINLWKEYCHLREIHSKPDISKYITYITKLTIALCKIGEFTFFFHIITRKKHSKVLQEGTDFFQFYADDTLLVEIYELSPLQTWVVSFCPLATQLNSSSPAEESWINPQFKPR